MSKQVQHLWLVVLMVVVLTGVGVAPQAAATSGAPSQPAATSKPLPPVAAPAAPQQANGQGGIFIDVQPKVVPAYSPQGSPDPLVGIVSSGWLPYDTIEIHIDGITTYPSLSASPTGFFAHFIRVDGVPPGPFRVRLKSRLTGQSATDGFYVTELNSVPLPSVAVAPHQARPGDYVAVLGVNYSVGGVVEIRRGLEVLATRQITDTNSPCYGSYSGSGCAYAIVRVPLTATSGAQVYGIYSSTLGATLGQSVEERADARTAVVPRAYTDQGIWRSGSPRRSNQLAEGFLPGEQVSVETTGRPNYNLTADQQGTVYSNYDYLGGGPASVSFTYSGQSSGRRAYAQQIFQPQGSDQPRLLISPSFALSTLR